MYDTSVEAFDTKGTDIDDISAADFIEELAGEGEVIQFIQENTLLNIKTSYINGIFNNLQQYSKNVYISFLRKKFNTGVFQQNKVY